MHAYIHTSISKFKSQELRSMCSFQSGYGVMPANFRASAGLSFVNDTVLERRAPPAPLRCYVCGQKYLNHTSLDLGSANCPGVLVGA